MTPAEAVHSLKKVMKTRANPAVIIGALSGSVVVLTFTTVLGFLEGRALRSELSQIKADAGHARQAHAAAETELAVQRGQLADLRRQVSDLQDAAEEPDPAAPAAAMRARIVRGSQIVGAGWVMTVTNSLTGQPEVNVVLETPTPAPAVAVAPQSSSAPVPIEYRYAYWHQQPLYTWGALFCDYPNYPYCTNDLPGFAPPMGQPPAATPPNSAPSATPAPPPPAPPMVARVTRTAPLRPTPPAPVVQRPIPYLPTMAASPPAARPTPVNAASGSRIAATLGGSKPQAAPVRAPVPRNQPLPMRPL